MPDAERTAEDVFVSDTRAIRRWINGQTVETAALINELEYWHQRLSRYGWQDDGGKERVWDGINDRIHPETRVEPPRRRHVGVDRLPRVTREEIEAAKAERGEDGGDDCA